MVVEILPEQLPRDFSMMDFPVGSRILDVGCGSGRYLRPLLERGYQVFGIDADGNRIKECTTKGLPAITAKAEALPFERASFDGIVCNVVLPYTEEGLAVSEWARVLTTHGEVRASYHGFGYALQILCKGRGLRSRLYALKMLVNTWAYHIFGHRLPGRLGKEQDLRLTAICESESQMKKYYREAGLELIQRARGGTFLGFPIVIYHRLRKAN